MPGAVVAETDRNLYSLLGVGAKAKDTEVLMQCDYSDC